MFIPFDVFQPTSTRKNLRVGLMGLLRTAESYRGDTTAAAGRAQRRGAAAAVFSSYHSAADTSQPHAWIVDLKRPLRGENSLAESVGRLCEVFLRRRQPRSYADGSRFQM